MVRIIANFQNFKKKKKHKYSLREMNHIIRNSILNVSFLPQLNITSINVDLQPYILHTSPEPHIKKEKANSRTIYESS